MPVSRFVSPFPPFSLSLDEKEELLHVSNEVYAATMVKCENFRFQDKGRLDPAVWKLVRERESTRVFHNRIPGADTGNRDMHLLLTTTTTTAGTLNDVMYGILNPSLEEFRIKTDYVGDTLFDMAVLEPIVLPTPEMPYESLNLRWAVKRVPLHVRLVAKHTDTVYLEGAGIRHLSNGERVGVHLFHSVVIRQMPALPQYDRFNLSLCEIWWETGPGNISSFMTSYFEFKESFKVPFVILSMADACLSNSRNMECALLKKLSWLVQNKTTLNHSMTHTSTREEGCSVCGSTDRTARHGLKSACAICSKYTCSKCRIKRSLSLFAPDGQLLKHEFRFCTPCMTSARHLDGAVIAAEDALRRHGGSSDGGRDNYHNQSYHVPSSSSVTGSGASSQSGDEMLTSTHRAQSTRRSTKGRTPLSFCA